MYPQQTVLEQVAEFGGKVLKNFTGILGKSELTRDIIGAKELLKVIDSLNTTESIFKFPNLPGVGAYLSTLSRTLNETKTQNRFYGDIEAQNRSFLQLIA